MVGIVFSSHVDDHVLQKEEEEEEEEEEMELFVCCENCERGVWYIILVII